MTYRPGIEVLTAPARPAVGRFRADLQGMRAVAVLLVILYHAGVPGLGGGFVGVDVFFVISGHLITGQLANGIPLLDFWARRARRLIPPATLVLLATIVLARTVGPALQVRDTARDAVAAALYVVNIRLAHQGVDYQHAGAAVSPLQHFWSLAVEEQFYLFWPLLILVVARQWLVPVVAVAAVGSLALSIHLTATAAPVAYFGAPSRAWEFGVGALLCLTGVRLPAWMAWAGLGAIAVAAVLFGAATPFPGAAALVPVLGCGAVLAAGGPAVLGLPPLQALGRWSYGWYLWHWPLIVLIGGDVGRRLLLSVVALVLAAATHRLFDRRGPVVRRRWLVFGAALAGVVVLVGVGVRPSAVSASGLPAPALDLAVGGMAALRAALAQAPTGSLPVNLDPTVENAVHDFPATEGTKCHLNYQDVAQGACVYGDAAATRTVVLIGDSHAQQWFGAFDSAAASTGWRLVALTKSSCPVAKTDLVLHALNRLYPECNQWRTATLTRIAALHPALVVVAQSDVIPAHDLTNTQWSDMTLTAMKGLQGMADRVLYLADTPDPRIAVPACVADHPHRIADCEQSRAAVDSALDGRRADLVRTLTSARVPVLDPTDWLCSSTRCPVVLGNTLVYRDDSHISDTLSRLLAPLVEPYLR